MPEINQDDNNQSDKDLASAKPVDNKSTNNQNLLSVAIKDKNVLYATYMGFVKPEGGLFIPTKKEFKPGERLSLLIVLLEEAEKYEIIGRVVWVTPKGVHGARAPGVGVQFEGSKAKDLNSRIKQILALDLQSDRPTYTM